MKKNFQLYCIMMNQKKTFFFFIICLDAQVFFFIVVVVVVWMDSGIAIDTHTTYRPSFHRITHTRKYTKSIDPTSFNCMKKQTLH